MITRRHALKIAAGLTAGRLGLSAVTPAEAAPVPESPPASVPHINAAAWFCIHDEPFDDVDESGRLMRAPATPPLSYGSLDLWTDPERGKAGIVVSRKVEDSAYPWVKSIALPPDVVAALHTEMTRSVSAEMVNARIAAWQDALPVAGLHTA